MTEQPKKAKRNEDRNKITFRKGSFLDVAFRKVNEGIIEEFKKGKFD